jgi:hypothetical protein
MVAGSALARTSSVDDPAPLHEGASPLCRRLIVTWQNPRTRSMQPVGILVEDRHSCTYRFHYLKRAAAVENFRPFLGFPQLERSYRSKKLFPLFSQRVMDARRPDYQGYLDALGLSGSPGPMEVLARSSGKRVGDTIQLFPEPKIGDDGSTSCLFLAHGVRHIPGTEERIEHLGYGEALYLLDDLGNSKNPRAVLVTANGSDRLGWVPDLLLEYIHVVRGRGPVQVAVERANGRAVSPHMRLLVSFSGTVPAGYQPFTGAGWETFA